MTLIQIKTTKAHAGKVGTERQFPNTKLPIISSTAEITSWKKLSQSQHPID